MVFGVVSLVETILVLYLYRQQADTWGKAFMLTWLHGFWNNMESKWPSHSKLPMSPNADRHKLVTWYSRIPSCTAEDNYTGRIPRICTHERQNLMYRHVFFSVDIEFG